MSRDLTSSMQTEVAQPQVMPVFLAEFDFDSATLYMWSGLGDLVWNSNTYTGTGNLCGVTPYNETSDLASQGLSFSLNGIPSTLISVALSENYQRRPCRLYLGFINRSTPTVLVADPYQLFDGPMDTMVATDDGQTATITLNAENVIFLLSQPNIHYYTPEDQKSRYSDDLGLDFIAGLQNKEVIWKAA